MVTVSSNDADNFYTALFAPTTSVETVAFNGVFRLAPMGMPAIFVDGNFIVSATVLRTNSAQITLETTFGDGMIVYTLDGTAPSFESRIYSGPFNLNRGATIRALAYNADFSESVETDPVELLLTAGPPFFSLVTSTPGGGTFSVSPTRSLYASNTPVTLYAIPNPGWSFLKWLGDASGTEAEITFSMTSDRCVEALFGSALFTRVTGGGSISLSPIGPLYPYGTTVQLMGMPSPGNSFALWGDAAASSANPLKLVLTNSNPTVSALFAPLDDGQFALVAGAQGSGRVHVNPNGNRFNAGQQVSLTAISEPEQEFLGWTGDTNVAVNSLSLAMNRDWSVTASFSRRPRLSITGCPALKNGSSLRVLLTGESDTVYELEGSLDLRTWATLGQMTNSFGTTDWRIFPGPDSVRFLRARLAP